MLQESPKLWIEFEYRAIENRPESRRQKRPIYDQIEFYKITLPGGKDVRIGEVTMAIREQYKAQYDAWKADNAMAEQGTDLRCWAMLPINLLYEARAIGIKTVEALVDAELNEATHGHLFYYQEQALNWLCQDNETVHLREENMRLKQELTQLKAGA